MELFELDENNNMNAQRQESPTIKSNNYKSVTQAMLNENGENSPLYWSSESDKATEPSSDSATELEQPNTQVAVSSSGGIESRNMAGNEKNQPPKRKAGRPRKDTENDEKSENKMSLYFTDSDYEKLRILANIADKSAKEFIEALIKREIKKYSDDIDARQQRDKQIKADLGI